jgi:hypothetical protein
MQEKGIRRWRSFPELKWVAVACSATSTSVNKYEGLEFLRAFQHVTEYRSGV